MDAEKKVQLEQRIVMGLMVVFVFFFVRGPMKRLGWFQAHRGLRGVESAPVPVTKPVGAMVAEHWQHQDEQVQAAGAPQRSAEPITSPVYTAHAMRDPFGQLFPRFAPEPRPDTTSLSQAQDGGSKAERPPALRIAGVVWGGDKPNAIINGEVYGVNDVVAGAKIVEIDQAGVTVEHAGSRVVYSLSSPNPGR